MAQAPPLARLDCPDGRGPPAQARPATGPQAQARTGFQATSVGTSAGKPASSESVRASHASGPAQPQADFGFSGRGALAE